MSKDDILQLEHIILGHMRKVAEELSGMLSRELKGSSIHTGSWSNANGVIHANVSYITPGSPPGDSIDASIDVLISGSTAKCTSDICRPDGQIISDLAQRTISFQTLAELSRELDSFGTKMSSEIVLRLKEIILLD